MRKPWTFSAMPIFGRGGSREVLGRLALVFAETSRFGGCHVWLLQKRAVLADVTFGFCRNEPFWRMSHLAFAETRRFGGCHIWLLQKRDGLADVTFGFCRNETVWRMSRFGFCRNETVWRMSRFGFCRNETFSQLPQLYSHGREEFAGGQIRSVKNLRETSCIGVISQN